MLNYRDGLADMPLYDTREQDWNIKVNANESNVGLPPLVEDRVMTRLSRIAFPRYPNEESMICSASRSEKHMDTDGKTSSSGMVPVKS